MGTLVEINLAKVEVVKPGPKQACFSSTLCQRPELGKESLQYYI